MTNQTTYVSVADTAKLIRAALKAKFPGVKFGVRSKSYSGGASINVSWTLGPTTDQVKAVAGRFRGAEFDGMTDCKNYVEEHLVDASGNIERVHYGADYVFCDREYGDVIERCARHLCTRYRVPFNGVNTLIPDWASDAGFLARQILSASPLPDGYHGIVRAAHGGLFENLYRAI